MHDQAAIWETEIDEPKTSDRDRKEARRMDQIRLFQEGMRAEKKRIDAMLDPGDDPELDLVIHRGYAARNDLITENQGLVLKIAKPFAVKYHRPFDDCIQIGNLALMRVADLFDPDRGIRFSTYATHAIWRLLHRSLRQGVLVKSTLSRRSRVIVETDFASATTEEGLAKRILEEMVSDDHPEAEPPRAFLASESEQMHRALVKLKPSQQYILIHRFGLYGNEARTLQSIGNALNLSKERIRQLETRAKQLLKEAMLCPT